MTINAVNQLKSGLPHWYILVRQLAHLGLPWHRHSSGSASPGVRAAKKLARGQLGRNRHLLTQALFKFLMVFIWPVLLLHMVYRCRREEPKWFKTQSTLRVYLFCVRHQLAPSEYFLYELYSDCLAYNVDDYLFAFESTVLTTVLNTRECNRLVGDKFAFYNYLQAEQIPVPPTILIENIEVDLKQLSARVPTSDLFVKPRYGSGGAGTEHWHHLNGEFWRQGCLATDASCFVRHVHDNARLSREDQLIQPFLENHSLWKMLSFGQTIVLRVVSIGRKDKGVCVALVYALFPVNSQKHNGNNLVACVDVNTGTLLRSYWHHDMASQVMLHPDTGHKITGTSVPEWRLAKRLVVKAHLALDGAQCLAWDVAVTSSGPVILEANCSWCCDEFQRCYRMPVGATVFGDKLAQLLRD